jgi:hypothetical protein
VGGRGSEPWSPGTRAERTEAGEGRAGAAAAARGGGSGNRGGRGGATETAMGSVCLVWVAVAGELAVRKMDGEEGDW